MILYGDHREPEMRYEGLARQVFDNCNKWGDPFGIAAQEFYTNLAKVPNDKGKRGLSKLLSKMIIDLKDTQHQKLLLSLEAKIWVAETEDQIIDIIDSCIEIIINDK